MSIPPITPTTQAAIARAEDALNLLMDIVPVLPPEELRASLCHVMLLYWSSDPPTKGELGLCGLAACAMARLKELERL